MYKACKKNSSKKGIVLSDGSIAFVIDELIWIVQNTPYKEIIMSWYPWIQILDFQIIHNNNSYFSFKFWYLQHVIYRRVASHNMCKYQECFDYQLHDSFKIKIWIRYYIKII